MPLIMAQTGKAYTVKEIRGGAGARLHLKQLGFVAGVPLEIITRHGGNTIVKLMETRVAVGAGLASKIIL